MLKVIAGKKYCANFKRKRCVSTVNPQPFDNFTFFGGRVGPRQRCDTCIEFYKKRNCLNFKKGQCFSKCNPQSPDNFSAGTGRYASKKICRACEQSGKRYCANAKRNTCTASKNPQSFDNFDVRGENKNWLRSQCRSCDKAHRQKNGDRARIRSRKWFHANKDRHRDWNYKRLYGISLKEYKTIFKKQNGCCGICRIHQSKLSESLCVDHSHSTGKVRGLLCHNCNRALGCLQDSVRNTKAAVTWLKRNK